METVADSAKNALIDPELSRRLHLALTTDRDGLLPLMDDPSADVLQAALRNPNLEEDHLVVMLKRRDLTEELFRKISKSTAFNDSHAAKVALAHNPDTPGNLVHSVLHDLHLFELVTLCFLPGVSPDLRVAAERGIIQQLPSTSLGNKLTLARRATDPILETLMKEGHPQVVDACLGNPRLKENAVFLLLNSAATSPEVISAVARHGRWKERANIRMAILRNRNTPRIWFTLFLPGLSSADIRKLISGRNLTSQQIRTAEDELTRRRKG